MLPLPLSDDGQTNLRQVLDRERNTKAVDVDHGSRSRTRIQELDACARTNTALLTSLVLLNSTKAMMKALDRP